ncbi:MAG: hypothetical protein IPL48_01905 [Bacteroidetes bacterium]|nr:hypothetical protein [Bacteroidota bacterium]
MSNKRQVVLYISLLIVNHLGFSQSNTIYIDKSAGPNELLRTNYINIFNEDFNGPEIDTSIWNVSDYNDDGTVHCTDPNDFPFTINPSNVKVENGYCEIQITDEAYAGCECSAGEIKSYSIKPESTLIPWSIGEDYYIEIGVEGLVIDKGIGSAAWLFTPTPEYNEIDIWETDGKHKHIIYSTYWWEELNNSCTDDPLNKIKKMKKIKVKDKNSGLFNFIFRKRVDLTQTYLVFGLEITHDNIKYYMNGIRYWNLDLSRAYNSNSSCDLDNYDKSNMNKGFRIGTQPNSVGDLANSFVDRTSLPQSLKIDYIRIYKKESDNAIKFQTAPNDICLTQGFNITATYFPNVDYVWESEDFILMPNDNNVPFERWAIFNNTSPLNEYKNILLNVTLPNVQAEELNKIIFVDDGIIDTPEIELIEDLAICRYHLKCQKDFSSQQIYWSFDSANWNLGNENDSFSIFGNLDIGFIYNVYIKKKAACDDDSLVERFDINLIDSTMNCKNSSNMIGIPTLAKNFQYIAQTNGVLIQHPEWESGMKYRYRIFDTYGRILYEGEGYGQYISVLNVDQYAVGVTVIYENGIERSDFIILPQ